MTHARLSLGQGRIPTIEALNESDGPNMVGIKGVFSGELDPDHRCELTYASLRIGAIMISLSGLEVQS
jgi:hypothetical protein